MSSPYEGLPERRFWSRAVAQREPDAYAHLYVKRFQIDPEQRIVAAGSCFAQHISRELKRRGFAVVDVEPPPAGLQPERRHAYGYDLCSARFGNVYTTRQLLQLLMESFGSHTPDAWIWEKDGRYYDGLRPSVEPGGLATPELVAAHRQQHLEAGACDVHAGGRSDLHIGANRDVDSH